MTLQREETASATAPGEDGTARAALLAGGACERVASVLEEQGFEFERFDSAADHTGMSSGRQRAEAS